MCVAIWQTQFQVVGGEISGGFTDPAIVIKFEHMASAASHVRCQEVFSSQLKAIEDGSVEGFRPVFVVSYRGDATNQEALEKAKVHLSEVVATFVDRANPGSLPYVRGVPDIQKVP